MKKLLLLISCVACTLSSIATDYTDIICVSVNGVESIQKATIQFNEQGNTATLSLKNFILDEGTEDEMPVGNITLENVTLTQTGNAKTFSINKNILIQPGNKEGMEDDDWAGPALGEVPVMLKGTLYDNTLYVNIYIEMEGLDMSINVDFGGVYKDALVIEMAGNKTTSEAVVNFQDQHDGTGIFTLRNFTLDKGTIDELPVGNIIIPVALTKDELYDTFSFSDNIEIQPGNLPDMEDDDWAGTFLGQVQTSLTGRVSGDRIFVELNIYHESVGDIHVTFGDQSVVGIQSLTSAPQCSAARFDLQGRTIRANARGIQLHNGQKTLK